LRNASIERGKETGVELERWVGEERGGDERIELRKKGEKTDRGRRKKCERRKELSDNAEGSAKL